MKTSVVVYRNLNGVQVRQESKNGFFNANDLLELYNKTSKKPKEMKAYLKNKSTKELITALQADFVNGENSTQLVLYSKRGKFGGTWMHPYLLIDFGMWLSTEFKITVIKWVYDNLIKYRNDCGDGFNDIKQALFDVKPNSPYFIYSNEANMINKLVFGSTQKEQRNGATEDQLKLLDMLQKIDTNLIKKGLEYFERYDKLKEITENFVG